MSEPRTGSRYELQVTRKSTTESKAVGDYFAVHPGDVEEIKV
jgi:pyruvate formate lyase activating enzyme